MGFFDFLKPEISEREKSLEAALECVNKFDFEGARAIVTTIDTSGIYEAKARLPFVYHYVCSVVSCYSDDLNGAIEHQEAIMRLFDRTNDEFVKQLLEGRDVMEGYLKALKHMRQVAFDETADRASLDYMKRLVEGWELIGEMEPVGSLRLLAFLDGLAKAEIADPFFHHKYAQTIIATSSNWAKARDVLRKADKLFPENFDIMLLLGTCYQNLGRNQEAIKALSSAIEIDETNPLSYVQRALVYASQENLSEALVDLNEAIYQDPNCEDAYFLHGVVLFETEDYPKAFTSFQKVLELLPGNIDALRYSALIAHMAGEKKVAMNFINEMRKVDKEKAEVFAREISDDPSKEWKRLALGAAGLALLQNPDVIGKACKSLSNAVETGKWEWPS